jgi:hypothetical protein
MNYSRRIPEIGTTPAKRAKAVPILGIAIGAPNMAFVGDVLQQAAAAVTTDMTNDPPMIIDRHVDLTLSA